MSLWQKIKAFFFGPKKPSYLNPQVKDGVWYAKDSSGNYLLGIDNSVNEQMGEITFVDFPNNETKLTSGDDLLDVEGDKAVVTLKSPISGTVISRNQDLGKDEKVLNKPDPKVNWILKLSEKN